MNEERPSVEEGPLSVSGTPLKTPLTRPRVLTDRVRKKILCKFSVEFLHTLFVENLEQLCHFSTESSPVCAVTTAFLQVF